MRSIPEKKHWHDGILIRRGLKAILRPALLFVYRRERVEQSGPSREKTGRDLPSLLLLSPSLSPTTFAHTYRARHPGGKGAFSRRLAPHRPMPPPRASSHVLGETSDTRYGPAWGLQQGEAQTGHQHPLCRQGGQQGNGQTTLHQRCLRGGAGRFIKRGRGFDGQVRAGTAAPP